LNAHSTNCAVSVALLGLFLFGCAPRVEKAIPWTFENDQYVFIEYRLEEDGRVLQGEFPAGPMIDFPTYMFDPHSGALASQEFTFEIDDTLMVIIGRSTALRGVAGGGMASKLRGVYKFPYQFEDLILRGVDEYGNVHIGYRDEPLVIESGDEWNYSTTRRDTVRISRGDAIAEFTKTTRIINYGLLDKSNIRKW